MESIRCSTCNKRQGTCLCSGCKKYFCMQDFRSHRNGLANELDSVISDRNSVQDKLNKSLDTSVADNHLLLKITEWEEEMIRKVKETAESVRQQVTDLQTSKREEIKNEFNKTSKELIEMKETEDFIESDISRLRQNIQQFNQDLNLLVQPNTVQLYTNESNKINWNRLIYIQETSKSTNSSWNSSNARNKKSNRLVASSFNTESSIWDDEIQSSTISAIKIPTTTLPKCPAKKDTLGASSNSADRLNKQVRWFDECLAEEHLDTRPLRSTERENNDYTLHSNSLMYTSSDDE